MYSKYAQRLKDNTSTPDTPHSPPKLMRNKLIILMALASAAYGDQNLTIDSTTTGNFDQLNGNGNTVSNITVTENATINRLDGSSINNLTTITLTIADNATFTISGNAKLPYNNTDKTYNTTITLGNNSTWDVGGILYFGSRNSSFTDIIQNTSIQFGSGASISAGTISTVAAEGGDSYLTLSADFDSQTLSALADTTQLGTTYSRTLITTTNGLENYNTANVSLSSLSELEALGYQNVGVISSIDNLGLGQYGILYSGNILSMVAKTIPEPSTGVLAIVALSALAMRRRRPTR